MVVFKNNNDLTQPKTFAMRFDNIQAVQKLQNILNNPAEAKKFKKDLKNKYDSDNSGLPLYESTTTLSKQQRHLFNLLDKSGLNMSLYEANFDSDNCITDWQKVNKDTLEKEPCN